MLQYFENIYIIRHP